MPTVLLGDAMRRATKLKIAVLFLLAILLSGSAAVSLMVSGIVFAATIIVILCLLIFLAAVARFSKKKNKP